MPQFMTDITHLAPSEGPEPDLPEKLWKFRDYLGRIISAATFRADLTSFISGLPCRTKVNRKPCQGTIKINLQHLPVPTVHWDCTRCEEGGAITGWRRHLFDKSKYQHQGSGKDEATLSVVLAKDEFQALLESDNIFDIDSERIVLTGECIATGVRISGLEGDMDNLAGYVATNSSHAKRKKVGDLLHSAFIKIDAKLEEVYDRTDQ
jgi:hypothetical protein